MTSKEAFAGIRKIETEYGKKFLPIELHPIWTALLELPAAAMNHAIGEMKMIWNRPPTNYQVLESVKNWTTRLKLEVMESERNESDDIFSLTFALVEDRISETEYIQALYAMASKYGKPEYAMDAERREAELRAKQAA
jgi:hypothetical protein